MAMNPRLLRPRATGFTPRSISGLALWLDGADSSSLYTTDAGPVTAVSAPTDIAGCVGWYDASRSDTLFAADTGSTLATTTVGRWANLGTLGSAADLLQATSGNRPAITANALAGKPVLTFNGTAATLRTGSITLSQPFQYYMVFRFDSAYSSGAPRVIDAGTQPSPGRSGEVYRQDANTIGAFSGGTNTAAVTSSNIQSFGLHTFSFDGASSYIRYKAGDIQSSATAGTTSGSRLTVGGDSNVTATSFSNISVAELIVFNTALSTTDRARVEAYLAAKWGISGVHTQATATSDPVGYWADKSGNGRHATQADGTRRPLISTTANRQNGKNGLTYDNVNDTLSLGNISAAFSSSEGSGFFVYRTLTDNIYSILTTRANNSVTHEHSAGVTRTYNGAWRTTRINGLASRLPFTASDPAVVHTLQASSSLYEMRNNSALVTSTTGNWNAGSNYEIGADSAGGSYLNGMIYEALLYSRVLPESERRRVEQYLATKWGITLAPQVSNLDAQDWIDRVYANGGTVSTSTAAAVNTFCNDIDAAGIRDRFYRLNLFCGTSDGSLNAVRTPLYRGQSRTGTQYGDAIDANNAFQQTDYAENNGLLGNTSTKWLNTGLNANTAGLTVNSIHLSTVFPAYSHPASNNWLAVSIVNAAVNERFWLNATANAAPTTDLATILGGGSVTATKTIAATNGATMPGGLWVASRVSATDLKLYNGNTEQASVATSVSGAGVPTNPVSIFARWNGTSTFGHFGHRMRAYSVGLGMTAQQVSDYNAAMTTFQTALGRT